MAGTTDANDANVFQIEDNNEKKIGNEKTQSAGFRMHWWKALRFQSGEKTGNIKIREIAKGEKFPLNNTGVFV